MTLTGAQRRNLAAQAHTLKPIVQIGKNGLTQEQIDTIKADLENHELIKIKYNDYKNQKQELSEEIAQQTESDIVQIIGNVLTLYKQNPEPAKRKINP